MSANKIIQAFARKTLTKNQGSGITTIANQFVADSKAGEILTLLKNAGFPINQLDDYIRSEADLLKFLNIIKNSNKPRVISGSSAEGKAITEKLFGKKGEVVEFPQKRSFAEEIDAMKKSGDIVDPNNLKKNDNVLTREMFQDSNLNKVARDRDRAIKAKARIEEKDSVTETISYIKTLEPMTALKEANLVIGRKGKYKDLTPEQSKKILQDTEDHIFERDIPVDPEDMADGGRIGFSGGRGVMSILKNIFKPKPKKLENTVKEFLEKRQFLKDIVGNTEKNKKARDLKMLKDAAEEARKNPGFKFKDVDVDKDIRPIFDKEIAESLKKDRKLNATGGRAGFYTGGITDVEPSLDDIGHGADALNARTRLMSPGSQATTSTGLNYLLAEDNDNMRIPFAGGGDPKRRAFLKLMATLTGGAAAFKSGLLSLGEGGAKKAVTETVKQSAGSGGQVPPYFLKLVSKIKAMGDDASKLAVKDREKVTTYKDYTLTEDVTTGEKTIQRMKVDDNLKYDASEYYGKPVTEDVYMNYKPGKSQIDETTKGKTPPDEYTEDTSLIRSDRPAEGEIMDTFDGVPDDVIEEAMEKTIKIGKADGGRIGFYEGGDYNRSKMKELADAFARQKYGRTLTDLPDVKRFEMEDLAIKSLSKDIEKKADGGLAAMLGE